jgi:hypothetical protein
LPTAGRQRAVLLFSFHNDHHFLSIENQLLHPNVGKTPRLNTIKQHRQLIGKVPTTQF